MTHAIDRAHLARLRHQHRLALERCPHSKLAAYRSLQLRKEAARAGAPILARVTKARRDAFWGAVEAAVLFHRSEPTPESSHARADLLAAMRSNLRAYVGGCELVERLRRLGVGDV